MQIFNVCFSPNGTVYRVENGSIEVKSGKSTPRTTLRGTITIIKRNGSKKAWHGSRYDTGRLPIFV